MDLFPDDDDDVLSVMENLDEQASAYIATQSKQEDVDQPTSTHIECLKSKFGHSAFRPSQWTIIRSILTDRRDNCVVMSTGYGKSLCFQFPSVYTQGITIVVSPLISLMQDQVLALTVANIPACLLGSAQTDRNVFSGVINGDYRLVYLSPEYLASSVEWLVEIADRLTLIAIDEAHCVSQWGHDFRQCYRTLGRIRQHVPDVPILAVTATATQRVRDDICSSLKLRNPQMVCTGFDRPNLEFIVRPKTTIWEDLRLYVSGPTKPKGSIIVYCLTRKVVETAAQTLNMYGVVCEGYHAGLSLKRREDIHERFVRDKLQIIVATVAFGMGIDKPDVRLVIHYGASKDLESYYQEVGRAGRDGLPARCVMFQSDVDFDTHMRLRALSKLSTNLTKNMDELTTKMKKFVRTDQCRRLYLLQYFEGLSANCTPRVNCCDNCSRPKISHTDYDGMNAEGQFDFTDDATLLLQAIDMFNGYGGLAKPISVLRGSQNQSIKRYHQHVLHGRGKFKSDAYWKQLAEMLETKEMLVKSRRSVPGGFPYAVVELTRIGTNWLHKSRPLWLKPTPQMLQFMRKKCIAPVVDLTNTCELRAPTVSRTEQLVNALLVCRTTLATRFDVMPYMITSNLALEQLAQIQPLNLGELKAAGIDGMSDAKIQQFGNDLIKCILQQKHFLANSTDQQLNQRSMVALLTVHPMPTVKITDCHLRLLPLITDEASIDRMCLELGIKDSTIFGYMAILIKGGYPIKMSNIERMSKLSALGSAAILSALPKDDSLMTTTLRPLKESLPSYIQYDQIKLVLAYAQVRNHLKSLKLQFDDPDVVTESTEDSFKTDNTLPENDVKSENDKEGETEEMEEDLNFLEMLEDMNIPIPETHSQNSNVNSELPLELDSESDFDNQANQCTDSQKQIAKPSTSTFPPSSINLIDDYMDDSNDQLLSNFCDETKLIDSSNASQQTASKSQSIASKMRPSKRIKYDSGSDDEDESKSTEAPDQPVVKQSSRQLPSWMLQKTSVPAPKVPTRKRSFF